MSALLDPVFVYWMSFVLFIFYPLLQILVSSETRCVTFFWLSLLPVFVIAITVGVMLLGSGGGDLFLPAVPLPFIYISGYLCLIFVLDRIFCRRAANNSPAT